MQVFTSNIKFEWKMVEGKWVFSHHALATWVAQGIEKTSDPRGVQPFTYSINGGR